jgi:hypothetical protein
MLWRVIPPSPLLLLLLLLLFSAQLLFPREEFADGL